MLFASVGVSSMLAQHMRGTQSLMYHGDPYMDAPGVCGEFYVCVCVCERVAASDMKMIKSEAVFTASLKQSYLRARWTHRCIRTQYI